jgi:hypothetical protein
MNFHKSSVGLICFFLLMAFITPFTQSHGWGVSGLFLAMITASGVAIAVPWLFNKWWERRKNRPHIERREMGRFLLGYMGDELPDFDDDTVPLDDPDQGREGVVLSRELVPSTPRAVVPYGYGDYDDDEELPDCIIEPNGMYLSDVYQPDINSFFAAIVLICGLRRTGKSNLVAVLIEELARVLAPLLIGDTDDECLQLANRKYMPRGFIACSVELYHELRAAGVMNAVAVDAEGAYEFGQSIARDVKQVVLAMKSFESDDDAALILAEMIEGINDWEQSQPNRDRVPCTVVLDEASKWLPQAQNETIIQDKTIYQELQQSIFGTTVRRGGKRGIGMVLVTHRIAELDKRAMQSDWKFLFRQDQEIDMKRYEFFGLDRSDVFSLRQGECFIFSPGVLGFRAMIRRRFSPHTAHTPGLEHLVRHLRRVQPIEYLSRTNYTSVVATVSSAEYAPEEERVQAQPLRADTRLMQAGRGLSARPQARRRIDPQLEKAVLAYLRLKAAGQKYTQAAVASANGMELWEIRKMWPAILAEVEKREAEETEEAEELETQE